MPSRAEHRVTGEADLTAAAGSAAAWRTGKGAVLPRPRARRTGTDCCRVSGPRPAPDNGKWGNKRDRRRRPAGIMAWQVAACSRAEECGFCSVGILRQDTIQLL